MLQQVIVSAISFAAAVGCTARAADSQAPGTTSDKPEYRIEVAANPNPVKKSASATYTLTIHPKGEYVLKTQTPFKAQLSAHDSVALAKSEFTAKDFKDPKSAAKSVVTTFTPNASGEQSISADLTFFLCTDELCQRFKDKAQLTVKVP